MKKLEKVTSYQERFLAEKIDAERELREDVGEFFGIPAQRARLVVERKLPEKIADHLSDFKTPWIWETDYRPLANNGTSQKQHNWIVEIEFDLPMVA